MSNTHTPPGRPRDPAVDRRITRAALDLFAESGWAGFAMETVARRAGVGKASLYLRWSTKESLLTDALIARLARIGDVDTGNLRDDLIELAAQTLDIYAGDDSRVAMRLGIEGPSIPGVAEHYDSVRRSENQAARAIVRRGIDRGELPRGTAVTMLLETLFGGAMMHALSTPPGKRASLVRDAAAHAARLVDFLLDAIRAADSTASPAVPAAG